MLKSKVSSNKSDIKILKDKIAELESLIENLKKNRENNVYLMFSVPGNIC